MIPVRTRRSNSVYRGPTPDVDDAWVERVPAEGAVYLTWQPSDEELEAIANGALIRLGIFGREPISPVSLGVTQDQQLSPIGAAMRDRALAELKKISVGPGSVPPGHWLASPDVWKALQEHHATDGGDGVPTLYSRPLMEVAGADEGTLEYAVAIDVNGR